MAEGSCSDIFLKAHIPTKQRIIKAMIPFTRTSPTLLWENQKIFKLKSVLYSVSNESEAEENCIDFSSAIELMQSSVEVFGGDTVEGYEEECVKFSAFRTDKEREANTIVEVLNESCLSVAHRYSGEGSTQPLVMDLAERHAEHVCGSWDSYFKGSQEEAIERQSVLLRYALDPRLNPTLRDQLSLLSPGSRVRHHIPAYGAVLARHVPVIRNGDMRLNKDWWRCGVVAVGAPDLRIKTFRETDYELFSSSNALDRAMHFLSFRGAPQGLDLVELRESLRRKISISLIAAVSAGYQQLVLGALGCGAYRNPTDEVARCFAQVLKETRFSSQFERVGFAVLGEPTFSLFRQHFLDEFIN